MSNIKMKKLLAENMRRFGTKNLIIESKNSRAIADSFKKGNDWDYTKIESTTNPEFIAALIVESINPFNDQEAMAEAAFIALSKSPDLYDKVAAFLPEYMNHFGETPRYMDPYSYVKSNIDTSKTYHKKSIDSSRRACKSSIFTDPTKTYKNIY